MTINEMIYKTLTTKITKEPKYKDALEALGYELVKDHDWSEYDYWGIRIEEDNKILLISKGKDNKRHLYKTASYVKTKDITKVDFANLIRTNRSETRWYNNRDKPSRTYRYKMAKSDYRTLLSICDDYRKGIQITEEKLCNDKKRLEYWKEQAEKSKKLIDEIASEIKK